MRDALFDAVDKADYAAAAGERALPDEERAALAEAAARARARLAFPESVLVAAFFGGTGSGKSSLVNALAGEEVVQVGGARPTTDRPAAVVPSSEAGHLAAHLEELGIAVVEEAAVEGLCLLDMPDVDSIELPHRHGALALAPLVDAIVWVTDPEKYRDAALHGPLARLRHLQGQFVFVINQADRLSEDELERLVEDLTTALREDGLESPLVVATAAAPPNGPPAGLGDLLDALEEVRSQPLRAYAGVVSGLAGAVAAATSSLGPGGVGWDEAAPPVFARAAQEIAAGDLRRAVAVLAAFLGDVTGKVGGPTAERIEQEAAALPRRVQAASAEHERSGPGWRQRLLRGRARRERIEAVRRRLEATVGASVRAALADRAMAAAALADAGISLSHLAPDPPR